MPPDTRPSAQTHVLVADDDPTSLKFFARLLGLNDYRVTTVKDGQQAQDRLQEGDIDVVLSDIGMPGLNGIQLLNAIGATDKDPPVVLITGNPQLETAVQAVHGRAVAYLHKPVDSALLLDAITRAAQVSQLAKARRGVMNMVVGPEHSTLIQTPGQAAFLNAQKTLWMAFQPIVSVSQGSIYAYEALVRNEDATLAPPPALLRAAEAQGKLLELGRQIRNQVATKCALVPQETLIFVNLLPQDLLDDELYSANSALSKYASRVVLEITERESLESIDELMKRLQALRAMGYRFALDDLGAGYSGLTSFLELKPDVVKLDMALVRNIHEHEDQRRLVNSIANMVRYDFNTLVVAEGVEKIQERDALRLMGIDLLQGFAFGKPSRELRGIGDLTLLP